MAIPALKSYEFVKELTEAGLTEVQAEIIVRQQGSVVDENIATKHDVELAKRDGKQDIESVRHDIELFKQDTKQNFESANKDVDAFKQDTKTNFELVRRDIDAAKKDVFIKLGTLIVTGLIATIGIIIGVLSMILR